MGRKYEHTMEFGGIMAPTSPAPVDNRSVVDSKADLINPDTWDGKAYEGMRVSIPSEKSVYQLTDLAKLTDPDYAGWTLIGDGSTGESKEIYFYFDYGLELGPVSEELKSQLGTPSELYEKLRNGYELYYYKPDVPKSQQVIKSRCQVTFYESDGMQKGSLTIYFPRNTSSYGNFNSISIRLTSNVGDTDWEDVEVYNEVSLCPLSPDPGTNRDLSSMFPSNSGTLESYQYDILVNLYKNNINNVKYTPINNLASISINYKPYSQTDLDIFISGYNAEGILVAVGIKVTVSGDTVNYTKSDLGIVDSLEELEIDEIIK